jgi:acyl carrier protein
MDKNEILQALNTIFREIFDDQSINLSASTNASDIDEWDSLNHAIMISKVEKHFKIKFELMEMLDFKNVGNMVDVIERKLASK